MPLRAEAKQLIKFASPRKLYRHTISSNPHLRLLETPESFNSKPIRHNAVAIIDRRKWGEGLRDSLVAANPGLVRHNNLLSFLSLPYEFFF